MSCECCRPLPGNGAVYEFILPNFNTSTARFPVDPQKSQPSRLGLEPHAAYSNLLGGLLQDMN